MIEIKNEILYLMILRFLVSKGIDPVLEINNVDPSLVAALRINDVGCSLFLIPFVHSHRAYGRMLSRASRRGRSRRHGRFLRSHQRERREQDQPTEANQEEQTRIQALLLHWDPSLVSIFRTHSQSGHE